MTLTATSLLLLPYKYWLIIPITVIEGPIISILAGFFIKLGYLNFLPAFIFLMIGDLVGDVLWYGIGYYWGGPFVSRFGKFFSVTEEKIAVVKKLFNTHHVSILFISKITMGFGFALVTLITAGISRVPFRRYILLNFFGQFIWTGILITVGFLFGNFYAIINDDFGKISIIALFIVAAALLFGFSKYLRERLTKKYSQ